MSDTYKCVTPNPVFGVLRRTVTRSFADSGKFLTMEPVDPKLSPRVMTHEEASAWVWEFRSFYRQRSRGNQEPKR